MALKFLDTFVDTLDYNSPFFYALLCIDGGIFKYKYKKEEDISYTIKIYGFDMYSLETIKNHLKDMIPNFIIISNNKEESNEEGDEEANTNIALGITKLNIHNL